MHEAASTCLIWQVQTCVFRTVYTVALSMLIWFFHCCCAAGNALAGPPAGSDSTGAQHRDSKTEEGEFWRCGSRGGWSAVTSLGREPCLSGRETREMPLLEPMVDKEIDVMQLHIHNLIVVKQCVMVKIETSCMQSWVDRGKRKTKCASFVWSWHVLIRFCTFAELSCRTQFVHVLFLC